MTTTPTLPPLPSPKVLRRVMPNDYRYGDVYGYTCGQMQAYALGAYQAGKLAGRPEYYGDGYEAGRRSVHELIADDAYAASFQTIGQYRQALLDQLGKRS